MIPGRVAAYQDVLFDALRAFVALLISYLILNVTSNLVRIIPADYHHN